MASITVKAGLVGLAVATSFGFSTLSARADNEVVVEQSATQSTAIVGNGNTAATANRQVADILQKSRGSRVYGDPSNGATVRQGVDQATGISGHGNVSGTNNEQNATVTQIKQPVHPKVIFRGYHW
jgi:hypothetical protein